MRIQPHCALCARLELIFAEGVHIKHFGGYVPATRPGTLETPSSELDFL